MRGSLAVHGEDLVVNNEGIERRIALPPQQADRPSGPTPHVGSLNILITPEQMREAIHRSGYLLEQRVSRMVEREGFFVETNAAYPDPQTGISREIDISAISGVQLYRRRGRPDFIFPVVLCECENNAQPVVFFETDPPVPFLLLQDVKCSGIPVKVWGDDAYEDLRTFLRLEKFHHYCGEGHVATQYCTFSRKAHDRHWMALHPEVQHQTFVSLINALEAAIDEHYSAWTPPKRGKLEEVNIQLYYPLLVLQGDIYMARESRRGVQLRNVRHVRYRREVWTSKRRATYQIDVIQESFLLRYLRMVDREVQTIVDRLKRRREPVIEALRRLVGDAKKANRGTTWRQVFEL